MSSPTKPCDVVIIGAGLTGLAAAGELQAAGRRVRLLEKGRGVGGRVATRRLGDASFDHGAQFLTARTARLTAAVAQWRAEGHVLEWCRGFGADQAGHVRWRGSPSMTALPKRLAQTLDVALEAQATAVRPEGSYWRVDVANGEPQLAADVVITAPVPQALLLLEAGGLALAEPLRARLAALTYERCLAVLAVLAAPSAVPAPGAMAFAEGPVAWLADNQRKGVSTRPALTIHASAAYSEANWERDRADVARELYAAVRSHIQTDPVELQVHGWRYSRPRRCEETGCVEVAPGLWLAGDAFAAPRVEGALVSGWTVAEAVRHRGGKG